MSDNADKKKISDAMSILGRRTSKKKTAACQANGKLGGRGKKREKNRAL